MNTKMQNAAADSSLLNRPWVELELCQYSEEHGSQSQQDRWVAGK